LSVLLRFLFADYGLILLMKPEPKK